MCSLRGVHALSFLIFQVISEWMVCKITVPDLLEPHGTPSENFPYTRPWSFGECKFKDGSCCKSGHVNEKLSGFSGQKNENLGGLHLGINLMHYILE